MFHPGQHAEARNAALSLGLLGSLMLCALLLPAPAESKGFANYLPLHMTLEVMAEWARLDTHASVDPRTWARRLKQLRSFTRWMQQFEPATEVLLAAAPDSACTMKLLRSSSCM